MESPLFLAVILGLLLAIIVHSLRARERSEVKRDWVGFKA